jgi:inner membrane protein
MDSVTHIFLGGAAAQAIAGRKLGKAAFFLGALAATIPDFDVFVYTGDSLRDHLFHRTFMHSLAIVPVLATLAMIPFLLWKKLRPQWRLMLAVALLACVTHTLLDTLTSYGTMIFWPFTQRRFALDIVAVIDPFYTVPLIVGAAMVLRRPAKLRPAWIALAVSIVYLGFATWQHHRAAAVQAELIAKRGQTSVENPRVLPQIGTVVNYRSIYFSGGWIFADGIRVLPLAEARVKAGSSLERAALDDGEVRKFADFADGFVASVPDAPGAIGDMRYTISPDGFDPVWGVEESAPSWEWRMFPRRRLAERIWRELVRPRGYLPVAALPG